MERAEAVARQLLPLDRPAHVYYWAVLTSPHPPLAEPMETVELVN